MHNNDEEAEVLRKAASFAAQIKDSNSEGQVQFKGLRSTI